MAKEKKIKVKKKIDWKHEMALAPGYIIVILWVAFTFMLLGWIIAASLSTTTDIFAGKALKFPSGLHFEKWRSCNILYKLPPLCSSILCIVDPDLCAGSICPCEIYIYRE